MASDNYQAAGGEAMRASHTSEEMRKACRRAIAFVLDVGDTPGDVAHAVAVARKAKLGAAYVFSKPAFSAAALEAVRLAGKRGETLVQAIEYDPAAAVEMTRAAGGFEASPDLPFGLLETMRVVAESSLDDYDSVVVCAAARQGLAPDVLFGLCSALHADPDADAVSAAAGPDGELALPCALARGYLDRIGQRDFKHLATRQVKCD